MYTPRIYLCRGRCSLERGSSMLEFAVLLPFLSIVLFGIAQYGLVFTTQMTLESAATAGARCATFGNPGDLTALVRSCARNAVVPFLDSARLQVSAPEIVGGTDGAKRVAVSYDYPLFFRLPGLGNGATITVRAQHIAR